jgi:Ni,Fe-hydrogenase I large subunit
VKVTTNLDGTITEADAHGNLFRGFENFLIGRKVNDAITFTQRICGVCPVPHGTAATFAADSVLGVSSGYATFKYDGTDGVPEAALHVRNMVLAAEFLMSSITHFYHLAAQSYVQGPPIPPWTPYFDDAQYHTYLLSGDKTLPIQNDVGDPNDTDYHGKSKDLWSAVITQYVKALRMRRLCLEAGALFAGRMPMMSNSVAGGTTNSFRDRDDFDDKLNKFRELIREVGTFVVKEYIPLSLALGALYPEFDNVNNGGQGWGAGLGNFLAWGGFPTASDTMAINGGWVVDAADSDHRENLLITRAGEVGDNGSLKYAKKKVQDNLKEFITCSRYANTHGYSANDDSAYPGNVRMTEPKRDDHTTKYSWLKAPRWGGYAMEVGPLARMVVMNYYPVHGQTIVSAEYGAAGSAYAEIYGHQDGEPGGADACLNGIDLRALDADLVSGLLGHAGLADVVTKYIAAAKGGLSTMDRLRARAIESYHMVTFLIGAATKDHVTGAITFPADGGWVGALRALHGDVEGTVPTFYRSVETPMGTSDGFGLVEAPRGALGHFVTASAGKIVSYQCVVPTTWNASPKDGTGAITTPTDTDPAKTRRGAMEQAMIGVQFDNSMGIDADGASGKRAALSGVEVLRVAQSFDPCIACAVH